MIPVFCSISKNELREVESLLVPSLAKQSISNDIHLYLLNYTGPTFIYEGVKRRNRLRITEVKNNRGKLGFGAAHNELFKKVRPSDFFIVTNTGYFTGEAVYNLTQDYSETVGMIDNRQLPFSHPKSFSRKDKTTDWASCACCLINSSMFSQVGGFDEYFWMYLEDVDLSWRSWLHGYSVLHEDNSCFYHFTGNYFKYRDDRYHLEHFWSLRNFPYLLYKYWGKKGETQAKRFIEEVSLPPKMKEGAIESYNTMMREIDENQMPFNTLSPEINRSKHIHVYGYNLFSK